MTISNEAVEAAAKAIMCVGDEVWELQTPRIKDAARSDARAALEAAAPFISAKALEDAADRFEQRSETLLKTMTNMAGHPDTSPDDVVRYGAYSAEANTTEHWLRARAAAVRGPVMTDLTDQLDAIQGATVTYAPQPYHKLTRQQLLTTCIALEDQRDRALDLAGKQQAAIDAVSEIHQHAHKAVEPWASGYRFTGDHCSHDGEHWPCTTIEALGAKP